MRYHTARARYAHAWLQHTPKPLPTHNTQHMLTKVISGGETGVDHAALRAAKRCSLATGGKIGRNYMTEEGPKPGLKDAYGLEEVGPEFDQLNVPEQHIRRSMMNVDAADGTLIVGVGRRGRLGGWGTYKTLGYCINGRWRNIVNWAARLKRKTYKPVLVLTEGDLNNNGMHQVQEFIHKYKIKTLNVAGPRQSKMGAPCDKVEEWLFYMLQTAMEKPPDPPKGSIVAMLASTT